MLVDHPRWPTSVQIAKILRRLLEEGNAVEIDGLGRFQPAEDGRVEFVACGQPRVFLAYVEENRAEATRLYDALQDSGFEPWLDHRKLLPGQNWPRAIEAAIETSDYFVACFSPAAVRKRGAFQTEIRYALDCARRLPLDETFLIPVRFEDCHVPARIWRDTHTIEMYPDWSRGLARLIGVLRRQWKKSTASGGPNASELPRRS
ncbi:MAG: toll/interleukin-1 receptor domain-containing protein [Bryobacteraceae bacterium]